MMHPAIVNPIICIIHTVISFLYAKNMSAVDIHHELCMTVYSQNAMSEAFVEYSNMGEQMFTMMSEVVGHL
jgi:hypothetical protein